LRRSGFFSADSLAGGAHVLPDNLDFKIERT
jgi:hypothetical protein